MIFFIFILLKGKEMKLCKILNNLKLNKKTSQDIIKTLRIITTVLIEVKFL